MVVSVEENQNTIPLNMFPNPSCNEFHIEGELAIDKIEIWDLTGRLILKIDPAGSQKQSVLHNLTSGVYNVKVFANDRTFIKKLAVIE
jgi:hypothetical protein